MMPISLFRRWWPLVAATVVGAVLSLDSCARLAGDNGLFIPGVSAMGVRVGVDDSLAVIRKLGPPEYISFLQNNGRLFMYPKLGMGVQFAGGSTLYSSALGEDSIVTILMLFGAQHLDNREVTMSPLRSREGLSMLSTPLEVIKAWGQPTSVRGPSGDRVDLTMTGTLIYPGAMLNYREGQLHSIFLFYKPQADSTIVARVVREPITPGQGAAGIRLGDSRDDVRRLLGDTRYRYTKLQAEYWFYPQYGVKVQFGVPPVEGAPTSQFLDTALARQVTAVTCVNRGLYEGMICSADYVGQTPDSIGPGTGLARVHAKLGEPLEVNPAPGMKGGMPYMRYPGEAFFFDPQMQNISALVVTRDSLNIDF